MTRTRTTPAAANNEKGKKPTNEKTLDIVSINPLYFLCPNNIFFRFLIRTDLQQPKKNMEAFFNPLPASSLALSLGPCDGHLSTNIQPTTAGSKGPTNAPLALACSEGETQAKENTDQELLFNSRTHGERRYIMQDGKWPGSI